MRTKAMVFVVAVSAVLSATTSASAARNECAGAVETGCDYCSFENGLSAQPGSNCDDNLWGYRWQGCAVFAAGACVVGGPAGRKCAFNFTTDITREAGWQTGDINAGPLVTGEAGTLYCSVVVNGETRVELPGSTLGNAVAVLVPQPLSFQAAGADQVDICTRWEGANGTLYWHGGDLTDATSPGWWDGNPGDCYVPSDPGPNDPECGVWKAIDSRAGTNIAEIWQDCEPYGPII
jgi:hypothetical protein